jgi:hypothetical protein
MHMLSGTQGSQRNPAQGQVLMSDSPQSWCHQESPGCKEHVFLQAYKEGFSWSSGSSGRAPAQQV